MHPDRIATLTPHQDINEILVQLAGGLADILNDRLVGYYLTGSLTYGDFERGSSDIDYLVVMEAPVTTAQRQALVDLHGDVGRQYPEWRERIEGSYVTRDMLPNVRPPAQGRPYINQGAFWAPDPPYGNEWLLNLYVLRECGIALIGPEPRESIGPVTIGDVREASKRDLIEGWLPKADDPTAFADSHLQAYVTLTLCRILHRAAHDGVASKRVASTWVKETYGEPWKSLVERAEHWSHGEEMGSNAEVRDFIRFTARHLDSEAPCSTHSDYVGADQNRP
ncbi:MAG: DUF4111 domain-containing protein [Chloroflexota bacterium]|nr:DUF4111 domain-containing protein [Chloroflexota bacterium]